MEFGETFNTNSSFSVRQVICQIIDLTTDALRELVFNTVTLANKNNYPISLESHYQLDLNQVNSAVYELGHSQANQLHFGESEHN